MVPFILIALAVLLAADTVCYACAAWPDKYVFMEQFKQKSAWIPGAGFWAVYRRGWRR